MTVTAGERRVKDVSKREIFSSSSTHQIIGQYTQREREKYSGLTIGHTVGVLLLSCVLIHWWITLTLFFLCFTNITQSWFRNCYVVNRLWFESWCVCPSGLELFRLSQKARPPHRKKKAPVAPGGHLISIQVQRVLVELANCRRRRSRIWKRTKCIIEIENEMVPPEWLS